MKKWNFKMFGLVICLVLFIAFAVISNSGITGFGQYFHYYYDGPTFFSLLLLIGAVLVFTGNGKSFCTGLKLAFTDQEHYSRMDLYKGINAIKYLQKAVYLGVGIMVIVGFINLLYHVDDLMYFGPAAAWMLNGFLYAAIFALFMSCVLGKLEHMAITYMEEDKEEIVTDEQTMYFKLRGLGLTDREAEVARLVSQELSNKEISSRLYISDTTVKKHITHILEKTGKADREALAELIKNL